jgi:hypothetical protein
MKAMRCFNIAVWVLLATVVAGSAAALESDQLTRADLTRFKPTPNRSDTSSSQKERASARAPRNSDRLVAKLE